MIGLQRRASTRRVTNRSRIRAVGIIIRHFVASVNAGRTRFYLDCAIKHASLGFLAATRAKKNDDCCRNVAASA